MARIKSKKYNGIYYNELENKDKSYYITYKDIDGKKVWQKIGLFSEGIREDYCNIKRNEVVNIIKNGELPPALAKKKKKEIIIFDDIANQYFQYKLDTKKQILKENEKEKQRYINHIKYFIGHIAINKLLTKDIEKIQTAKIGVLADSYVNQLIFLISSIIKYSMKQNIFKNQNPTQNIDNLKFDNIRERYLEKNEIIDLLEKVNNDIQLSLFVKLALSTGGRLNTIMTIHKKDMNLINNSITLKDHKNTSSYTGYLDTKLKEYLKIYTESMAPNDLIIKRKSATLQNHLRVVLNELFNTELDKDDSKNRVVIHTLRHTFASHLAIKGVPILTIQKLMNHKEIKMTLKYAKLAPDSGKDVIEGLYL